MIRQRVRKLISLLLTLVMVFSFSACNIAQEIRENISKRMDMNASNISSQEIIRHIIDAVNSESAMADSYSAIPENQLDGVSYSTYFEYIHIIRSIVNEYGESITYFKQLSSSDTMNVVGTNIFTLYPGLVGFELQVSDREGNAVSLEEPLYIFLLERDDTAYLSQRWVTGIIDIYNYGNHYVNMLEEQNVDGVLALLEPGYASSYSIDVVRAMSQSLINYYKMDVKSSREQYRIVSLLPNNLTVKIPETLDENGNYVDHFLKVTKDGNSTYLVSDVVPFAADQSMLCVYGTDSLNDLGTIRVGGTYSRDTIVFKFGEPKYEFVIDDDIIHMEVGEGDELEIIPLKRTIVMYKNLIFIFYSNHDGNGQWEGDLVSISVTGDEYYVSDSIRVGMKKSELQVLYPFMDMYGYEHTYTDENGNYILEFVFDEENVLSEIKMNKEI